MAVTITPRLVTALDSTWAAIQDRHQDVPPVVIALASGSGTRSLTYGHFAASRWVKGPHVLAELFIGGEGLSRGSRPVLGTLLHEAAHGVACTREIQDTSRQGRYHNTRFQALAGELGITVSFSKVLGWSITEVPDATVSLYLRELRKLDTALVAFRTAEGRKTRKSSNNGVTARCDCGRRIRVAASILETGPITCGLCDSEFTGMSDPAGSLSLCAREPTSEPSLMTAHARSSTTPSMRAGTSPIVTLTAPTTEKADHDQLPRPDLRTHLR